MHSLLRSKYCPTLYIFTFVYDNYDHNTETLSCISPHCTNVTIIQRPALDEMIQDCPQKQSIDTFRKRKRSFEPIDEDETNHICIQKRLLQRPWNHLKYLATL